ncbi:hypothetical protein ACM66B_003044 [Microbotryomycetes sp. NB124-2]
MSTSLSDTLQLATGHALLLSMLFPATALTAAAVFGKNTKESRKITALLATACTLVGVSSALSLASMTRQPNSRLENASFAMAAVATLIVDVYALVRALQALHISRIRRAWFVLTTVLLTAISFIMHIALVTSSSQPVGLGIARITSHVLLDVMLAMTLLKDLRQSWMHDEEQQSKLKNSTHPITPSSNASEVGSYIFCAACVVSCASLLGATGSVSATASATRSILGLPASSTTVLATSTLVACRISCLLAECVLSLHANRLLPPSLPTGSRQPETARLLERDGTRTTLDYMRAATPSSAIVVVHDDVPLPSHTTYLPTPLASPRAEMMQTPLAKPERSVLRSPPSSSSLHSSAFWTEQSPPPSRARTPSMMDVFQVTPSPQPSSNAATKRRSSLSVLQTLVKSPRSRAGSVTTASPRDGTTSVDDPFARSPSREAIETWRKRSASAMSFSASSGLHGASRVPTIFEAEGVSTTAEPETHDRVEQQDEITGSIFAEGLGLSWSADADLDSSTEMITARAVSLAMQDSTIDSFQTASTSTPFSASPTPPVVSSPTRSMSSPQLRKSPSSLWSKRQEEGGERKVSSPRQRFIASLRGLGNRKDALETIEHASHSDLSFACIGDSPRPSFAHAQAIAPRKSLSADAINEAVPGIDTYPPAPFMRQDNPDAPTTPSTLRGSVRQTLSSKKSWWKLSSMLRPNSRVGTPYRPRSLSAPALYSGSSGGSVGSSYDIVSATSTGEPKSSLDVPSQSSSDAFRLPMPQRLSPLSSALFERKSLERQPATSLTPSGLSVAATSRDEYRQGSLTSLEQLTVVADVMHRFSEDDAPASSVKQTEEEISSTVERRLHQSRSLSALVTSPRSVLLDDLGSSRPVSSHFTPLSPRLYAQSMGWTNTTSSTIESLNLDAPQVDNHSQDVYSPTFSTSEAASSPAFMFSPMTALFHSPPAHHPPMTPPTPMSSFLEFGMLRDEMQEDHDSVAEVTVKLGQ